MTIAKFGLSIIRILKPFLLHNINLAVKNTFSTNGIHDSAPYVIPLKRRMPWLTLEREDDYNIDLSWHLDYHITYASAVVCSLHDPTPEVIISTRSNLMIQSITQLNWRFPRAYGSWWIDGYSSKLLNSNPIEYRPSGNFRYTQYPNLKKI